MKKTVRCSAFSLLELIAVVTIVGVIAWIVVARFSTTAFDARRSACHTNRGDIELEVQRWFRDHGTWPSSNLSDIGADKSYFPEGLPTCPVDGSAYAIDPATHLVVGHDHATP